MKDRPILFSGPMVRAILDGRKTQTRRLYNATRCPVGVPGDRLWVRETFYIDPFDGFYYRADAQAGKYEDYDPKEWSWRPSIHMPRWASRITLEITGLRMERLQEISEEDAAAEGWKGHPELLGNVEPYHLSARDWFESLWNSIHGPGSWDKNPWVWVVEFEKI